METKVVDTAGTAVVAAAELLPREEERERAKTGHFLLSLFVSRCFPLHSRIQPRETHAATYFFIFLSF